MPVVCEVREISGHVGIDSDLTTEKFVSARPEGGIEPRLFNGRGGSGIVLINQTPQTQDEPEASGSLSWWRRRRVEPHLKHGLAVLVVIAG